MAKMPRIRADKESKMVETERRSLFSGPVSQWLANNWGTLLLMLTIVGIAFFLRTYFGFGPATQNGFLVSGGSDSYYHKRIIDYALSTGHQLYQDPLINYPLSTRNPRPPLFVWSSVILGYIFSPLVGSVDVATWYAFLFNTAFWGSMTVIPVYFITKESFGKKAGLIAAFLLAIMPGHIERSVFSNADHDAMVQFFVVLSFFFLLKALKTINGSRWVKDWKKKDSIVEGLKAYFATNRTSFLYSLMAALSLSAIAMIWKGFSYVVVIILVYYLVDLIISRFKNRDTMGSTMVVAATLSVFFLLIFPIYFNAHLVKTWYDVPLLMFLGMMFLGAVFAVTRDYPWTLVFGIFLTVMAVGYLFLMVIFPSIGHSILSGQGYLVHSKLYTTISEAQAPDFSHLAMSFGMVSFYLAFIGVAWAAVKVPKKATADFIFVVVWVAVAIYMATSAGRFVFNAAPAFAVTSGWILALIIKALNLADIKRNIGRSDWKHPWLTIKKAVKVRHVLGVLFVAFMIVLPNVWAAVDAGIPYEVKRTYDNQINASLPTFLASPNRPTSSIWYLGAFGYSLPLPSNYWPSAWRWFSQQDKDIYPEADRPAFVSWWDYGFEAAQEGHHPTVADNFQNGYQWAGNVITAQSENETIALFEARIIESAVLYAENPDGRTVMPNMNPITLEQITALMDRYGVDSQKVIDIINNPQNYVNVVLENPDVYGYYNYDLSPTNAKYAMLKVELSKIGMQKEVWMYNDLRQLTGDCIQYFAIDSRLFPFDARSTGIFYAPVKLSDRRIDNGTRNPVDFYDIKAVDEYGKEHALNEQLDPKLKITSYQIHYKDMFYNSMLYRSYIGYGPKDLKQTDDTSIPGLSGSLKQQHPMQAWNMSHFKLVYVTAYYNPYPSDQVRSHPEAWRAVSYEDAARYQQEIKAGNMTGVVDMTPGSGLRQGVVFVKYYDGALINGTVLMDTGEPVPGVRVTLLDEYGIPHASTVSDAEGHYSLVSVAGNVTLVASVGTPNPLTMIGSALATARVNVSEEQAMRAREDMNNDGVLDYNINQNLRIQSGGLSGTVFWDIDGDSSRSAPDQSIGAGHLLLSYSNGTFEKTVNISTDGIFVATHLIPGNYKATLVMNGTSVQSPTKVVVKQGETSSVSIAVPSGHVDVLARGADGQNMSAPISLVDLATGNIVGETTTDSNGSGVIEPLLPGEYELSSYSPEYAFAPAAVSVKAGQHSSQNITIYRAVNISGSVTLNSESLDDLTVFFNCRNMTYSDSVTVRDGHYSISLPQGYLFDVYSLFMDNGRHYVYAGSVSTDSSKEMDIALEPAYHLYGVAHPPTSSTLGLRDGTIHFFSGSTDVRAVTSVGGAYDTWLPAGSYDVYLGGPQISFADSITVSRDMEYNIDTHYAYELNGRVALASWESDASGTEGSLPGINIEIADSHGVTIHTMSNETGYRAYLVPGTYHLSVSNELYNPIDLSVSITDSNLTRDVTLSYRNITVEGMVTGSDGAPLNDIDISLLPLDQHTSYHAITDAQGQYNVAVKPGDYRISIDQNVTTWIKYLYDETVHVPAGSEAIRKNITLREYVSVSGNISNVPGNSSTVLRFIGDESRNITVIGGAYSLYLLPGNYSVEASSISAGTTYMNLSVMQVDIHSPATHNISLETAHNLKGDILYDGEVLKEEMTLRFTAEGGAWTTTVTPDGHYSIDLPAGNYSVSGERRSIDIVDGVKRYVVYSINDSVLLNSASTHDLDLIRDLDNYTCSGKIYGLNGLGVRANLSFVALNETAMDTEVESGYDGSYSVSLAPGQYSLYVLREDDSSVNITVFSQPLKDTRMDISLSEGIHLRGSILSDTGSPLAGANISVSSSSGALVHTVADADGKYFISLPSGIYNFSASGFTTEHGIQIGFEGKKQVKVFEPVRQDISLTRDVVYRSAIKWDSRQARTVKAGESVTYTFVVENTGNVKDTYNITASVPDGWSYEVTKKTVTLDFGEMNSTTVGITVTTSNDSLVKHSPVTVYAISQAKSNTRPAKILDLNIEPEYGVDIISPEGGNVTSTSLTYSVAVENSGNVDDSFTLTISNHDELKSEGWNAVLIDPTTSAETSEAIVNVNAHQKSEVKLILKPTQTYPAVTAPVILYAESMNHNVSSTESFSLLLPDLSPSHGSFNITGEEVSTVAPDYLTPNMAQLAIVIVLSLAAIYLARKKGVLR